VYIGTILIGRRDVDGTRNASESNVYCTVQSCKIVFSMPKNVVCMDG